MNPPQNTNGLNLEAENGSDNESDSNHAPEIIIINDNGEKTEVVDGTHLDTDEESDETQIGRNFFFFVSNKTNHDSLECLSKEWTSPIYVSSWVKQSSKSNVHVFFIII